MPTRDTDAVTLLGEARQLPCVDLATARGLNRLYRDSAPCTVTARGVAYRVQWTHDAGSGLTADENYRFKLGPHIGHLGLDPPSAATLLGERRTDLMPRDLRYILLADALHPAIDAIEQALRLHFEWQPGADAPAPDLGARRAGRRDPEGAAFFMATPPDDGATLRGCVQFEDDALGALAPDYGLARGRAATSAFDTLRVPVRFLIGSTPLRLREIDSIQPGDIVGIERWSSSGTAIVVSAAFGDPAGPHLSALAEGARITVQHWRNGAMDSDPPSNPAAAADSGNLPLERLDALEVTLRFEVGELSLSLGELKSIRAGHVFDLGQPLNRSPVRILAHGNVLGSGYLVAVGDRLGVRVSEFAPGQA
jgi:type III secretion protein Q